MIKKLSLALIWLVPCLGQQTQLNFSGVITGTLKGDDGTTIVGGYVTLQLVPPYPKSRLLKTDWTAASGSGGLFGFDGLNDGKYRLCAQVPQSTWLNPCEWGLQPPRGRSFHRAVHRQRFNDSEKGSGSTDPHR
jgi:hypothetical protein